MATSKLHDNVNGVAQSDEPTARLSPVSAAPLCLTEPHNGFQLIVQRDGPKLRCSGSPSHRSLRAANWPQQAVV